MLPDSFDVTAAPSELLVIEGRIATLSDLGIYVLQQRLVKHYTRLEVDIPALAKEAAPVLWEMHQQRDWVETVLARRGSTRSCVPDPQPNPPHTPAPGSAAPTGRTGRRSAHAKLPTRQQPDRQPPNQYRLPIKQMPLQYYRGCAPARQGMPWSTLVSAQAYAGTRGQNGRPPPPATPMYVDHDAK